MRDRKNAKVTEGGSEEWSASSQPRSSAKVTEGGSEEWSASSQPRSSANVTGVLHILRNQHSTLARAHRGIVCNQQILDAIWQHLVGTNSSHRGRHSIFCIAVQPRLWPHR